MTLAFVASNTNRVFVGALSLQARAKRPQHPGHDALLGVAPPHTSKTALALQPQDCHRPDLLPNCAGACCAPYGRVLEPGVDEGAVELLFDPFAVIARKRTDPNPVRRDARRELPRCLGPCCASDGWGSAYSHEPTLTSKRHPIEEAYNDLPDCIGATCAYYGSTRHADIHNLLVDGNKASTMWEDFYSEMPASVGYC